MDLIPDPVAVHYHMPNGLSVLVHRDFEEFVQELVKRFPEEEAGVRGFYGECWRVSTDCVRLLAKEASCTFLWTLLCGLQLMFALETSATLLAHCRHLPAEGDQAWLAGYGCRWQVPDFLLPPPAAPARMPGLQCPECSGAQVPGGTPVPVRPVLPQPCGLPHPGYATALGCLGTWLPTDRLQPEKSAGLAVWRLQLLAHSAHAGCTCSVLLCVQPTTCPRTQETLPGSTSRTRSSSPS